MIYPHKNGDVVEERYKVIDFIGEGGMQFVYRAFDIILCRDVALKTPKISSAEKRFHHSAVLSARVNHPNIAKTLDYFESTQGRAYLIEEFIDGNDLQKVMQNKISFLDPYVAAKILHYLAKGLYVSHRAGVIHRDLKPSNILVVGGIRFESIKITDFGIAKMAGEEMTSAVVGGEDTISASKTVVGALPYMAPEAILTPKDVGFKADIWSLGAMMYELLAGEKPFGTGLKAVHSILEAKIPPFPPFITMKLQFRTLSQQLIDIISKCLQKEPENRLSAAELLDLCKSLCYPIHERHVGDVKEIVYDSYGYIIADTTGKVFFNLQSVYGRNPKVGSKVVFSPHPGTGNDRAHPVICLD